MSEGSFDASSEQATSAKNKVMVNRPMDFVMVYDLVVCYSIEALAAMRSMLT